ncbi:MAG: hypothetical protein ACTHMY_22360 [Solirubrobacteraceae bacterium]
MTATASSERRELAHRTSDGIDVTLFWIKTSDRVTIAVLDTRSGEILEFEVAGSAALDAFNHPYAYAYAARRDHRAVSEPRGDAVVASTDR